MFLSQKYKAHSMSLSRLVQLVSAGLIYTFWKGSGKRKLRSSCRTYSSKPESGGPPIP